MRLRGGAVIAIGLASLAVAATAQAAPRYAAPTGSGPEPCTQAFPCSLEGAVTNAKTGDEVILAAGSYNLSKSLQTPIGVENLDIHGADGGAMPTIVASTTNPNYALEFRGAGGRLSYVAVEESAPTFAWGVLCTIGGRVERVRISASGSPSIGLLQGENCTLRDSLIIAEGSNAQAILATGGAGDHVGIARNVTAVGMGPDSTAITSSYSGGVVPGSYTLDARNVIASGAGADLRTGGGAFGVGHFAISNSNFESFKFEPASTITGSGNQTAPPVFVDAAGGDYREAAGSPTIDAGFADAQIGSLDLAGNPRSLGPAPDIGAFEVVPPAIPLSPPAAGQIQSLSLAPIKFRAAGAGEAIVSAKKKKAPIGTTVTYSLAAAAATVNFSVERRLPGRKVGKRCVKQTKANRSKRRCSRFKLVKGGFTHSGQAGQSRFKFSGRIGTKALAPGSYRLMGKTSAALRTANFRIVR